MISIKKLSDLSSRDDLEYWMNKSPQERIEAVEYLRRMHYGNTTRLQRTVRIIKLGEELR